MMNYAGEMMDADSATKRADIQRRLLELCPTAVTILERALRKAPRDSSASVDLAIVILQLAGFDGKPQPLPDDTSSENANTPQADYPDMEAQNSSFNKVMQEMVQNNTYRKAEQNE